MGKESAYLIPCITDYLKKCENTKQKYVNDKDMDYLLSSVQA